MLIFKQGSDDASYVKSYSVDDEQILAQYQDLLAQYSDTKFEDPTSILVIKVPNTAQVRTMLEKTDYTGDENDEEKIEIINHLLNRADCEIIKKAPLLTLEEARKKKKKKKRKTPKVTYTMGWPWYNDHMFNKHNGTCDCDKDKDEAGEDAANSANDAIGGGESVGDGGSLGSSDFGGDIGGGDGGGMGESLIKEAMTPFEKMQALENGTRGFNAAAASDAKLIMNYDICIKNNFNKARKIIEDALRARNLSHLIKPVSKISTNTVSVYLGAVSIDPNSIHPADVAFLHDQAANPEEIVSALKRVPAIATPREALQDLLILICLKETKAIDRVKEYIMTTFGVSSSELKDMVKAHLIGDTTLRDRINYCIEVILNENLDKKETSENMKLTEAKREIKRYYIRPQNIFCSNKAEILNALVKDVGENNCSVYSLKALDDHDDVQLLQPKDIIYYYDNGILYDKNRVKVMDYDLNVKHEEERKKFGNVDAISDATFDAEYEDRLTEDAFDLDFDDVNVFGEKLTEEIEKSFICCICGEESEGYGNNPAPIKKEGKCCDACNAKFVIPARLSAEA